MITNFIVRFIFKLYHKVQLYVRFSYVQNFVNFFFFFFFFLCAHCAHAKFFVIHIKLIVNNCITESELIGINCVILCNVV
ncbi:hypothetical protein C1646_522377 [Rhizophagus diaphanus]|nr:hypothetical protein C1646_522377 [Rhizophagus diaphanus] [Rhizophagus sp. MUCL 43196]